MSFTEQRVLKSIQILPQQSAVNVQWANQILKDGEIVSEQYERKAYIQEQYSYFLAEVDGAESYISVLGWIDPAVE